MRVEHLYRYPVKGLSAEALEQVALTPQETLPHDRRFALAQGDSAYDDAAPGWLPKRNFGTLAVNARLALLHTGFDPRTGHFTLRAPDQPPLTADLRTQTGRDAVAAMLTAWLGPEARGVPRLVEAPGHAFTDVAQKCVSIIGLSSLGALEAAVGRTLDPLRFRANVYVAGGPPWWEFALLGQDILLGSARLRVFRRIIRCPATQVDLATGTRDADPPRWLREHFGHADLGIYAEVIDGGTVAVGDGLEPLAITG